MRSEVIYFMDMEKGEKTDEHGDPVIERIFSDIVYAEIKSISQTEFYQAQTADKKPEIKFCISDYLDYQNQKYLIHIKTDQDHIEPEDVHEGVRYNILRTYRKEDNQLEITCYGGVRDAITTVSDKD